MYHIGGLFSRREEENQGSVSGIDLLRSPREGENTEGEAAPGARSKVCLLCLVLAAAECLSPPRSPETSSLQEICSISSEL